MSDGLDSVKGNGFIETYSSNMQKEIDMETINDMPAACVMSAPDRRTRFQRLMDRLFPWKRCPLPDAPAEWKDCVTVRTVTKLDFTDWLRVIVTGVVCVDVRTVTEKEVGATRTEVACFIGTYRDVRGER